MTKIDAVEAGKLVIRIEAEAVGALEERIGSAYADAVDLLLRCEGRVIVTGMGKSGIIARKIVATMNSTGTPSIFLHPSDAVHGDLGMVRSEDVAILISKSGNTEELKLIIPIFKRIGMPIIALLGTPESSIAGMVDIVLDVTVKEEACPWDLAPTASTTAALALGDALAITLLQKRGFTAEEFAFFHPGGMLGKRLVLRVDELMVRGDAVPCVRHSIPLKDAILEITSKRLGATCVVDDAGMLIGIITDGDLRRLLEKETDLHGLTAEDVMTRRPKTIPSQLLAVSAMEIMEEYKITQLVIVDMERRPIGMLHLHELVKTGLG